MQWRQIGSNYLTTGRARKERQCPGLNAVVYGGLLSLAVATHAAAYLRRMPESRLAKDAEQYASGT
jgi:hypothetical protein